MRALELGAVDFITKPKIDLTAGMEHLCEEICQKVKTAARANVQSGHRPLPEVLHKTPLRSQDSLITSTHKVIAIGTSTGGTEALLQLLSTLPPDSPGIVAVIHMPEGFTKSYADRLDRHCQIRVKEAEDGDRILPGHALLAPGNLHTEVRRSGAVYCVKTYQAPPVNRHRPSVNVLFDSCARYLGTNAVGAILTGMGNDGATGLLNMKQAGAHTIAQNEETCVVFGMPREAIQLGAVDEVLPLRSIASHLLEAAKCATLV
jgi:two-component system chemotaxis response regulator CheB